MDEQTEKLQLEETRALETRDQQLTHQIADLQRINEQLTQFACVAAHELKEPLRGVTGFCKLLNEKHKSELSEEAQELLEFAVDGSSRMSALIDDLLEFSRFADGQRSLTPLPLSIAYEDAIRHLEPSILTSKAQVNCGLLPVILGDQSQLAVVVRNLISNAIKFQKQDRPTVDVGAKENGTAWIISVRDNGIGIESDAGESIFQLFHRQHPHDEYAGTGVGLALCKRIIENHGGKIWFESEPDEGSTFFFTLLKT